MDAGPKVHRFGRWMDSGSAYDKTQYDDTISDGDVLVVDAEDGERVIGFLYQAWPIALTEPAGAFHTGDLDAIVAEEPRYQASIDLARELAD